MALVDADTVVASDPFEVVAWTDRRHRLRRPYVFLDNVALRSTLRSGMVHLSGRVESVRSGSGRSTVTMEGGDTITPRLVVDASGWPASFANSAVGDVLPNWQTAFGVVLPEPPAGDLGTPTLMDFRDPPGTPEQTRRTRSVATFAYSMPVADGWLVEETVLAASPAIEPVALVPLLAARLGLNPDAMLDAAVRTEYVRIPMGGSRPRRDQPVVAYGAAAGYVNPTSGYSILHSLAMAPSVARAIAASLAAAPSDAAADPLRVWNAVWPVAHRRTRLLHEYGLNVLVRLDRAGVREFFEAFFDLPDETWSAYLRSDTPPRELSGVMASLFRSAPWSTRRRLVRGNPAAFGRLLHPR